MDATWDEEFMIKWNKMKVLILQKNNQISNIILNHRMKRQKILNIISRSKNKKILEVKNKFEVKIKGIQI